MKRKSEWLRIMMDLSFPSGLLKYKFIRVFLSKIPRRIDRWESNFIKVNDKVVMLLPLSGSSSFIEMLKILKVSYEEINDVYNYCGKIDAVLKRNDNDRFKSGYTKKILNADKIGKAIMFSQLNVPYKISYNDFVRFIEKWNEKSCFDIRKIDKHFVSWENVEKYIINDRVPKIFMLEKEGMKQISEFIGVKYVDVRKNTSAQMKVKM